MNLKPRLTIVTKLILYQLVGAILMMAAIGILEFQIVRNGLYQKVLSNGENLLDTMGATLNRNPDLLDAALLQPIVLEFAAKIPDVQRVSVVDRSFRVIADSNPKQVGQTTDQTNLIKVIQDKEGSTYYYEAGGTAFYRLSHPILGAYNAQAKSNVIGAIAIDLNLSQVNQQVTQDFTQAMLVISGVTLFVTLIVYLLVRRDIAKPLVNLAAIAQKLGAGDLDVPLSSSRSDELGQVMTSFGHMTAQLKQVLANLQKQVQSVQTSADISRQMTAILDIKELLQYVVSRTQTEFNFYHTHIYLIEEDSGDLVMVEGSGEVGRQLKERGHRLPLGQGIVGAVATTNRLFLSNNVNEVPHFVRNALLPQTNSELAVPLRKGEQVLGVLDIQSEQFDRFTSEDMALIQSIADQTAVALDNARLLAESQRAVQEVERLNRRLTRESWQEFGQEITTSGYRFTGGVKAKVLPNSDAWLPPMQQAAAQKQLVTHLVPANGEKARAELAVPLLLRGEVIGVLGVKREETPHWAEEELAAVEAVAGQVALALENARLAKEQDKTIVKLKDVDRLKSEFLTSMSHELRTPLNSIIGFADVLLQGIDGDLPDLALNDIQLIHNSGKHLLALINDILDLAKIEAGRMELVHEAVIIDEIFESVLASASSLIKNKSVHLLTQLPQGLPLVYGDKLRLSQVLLNLVSNAAKFTHAGSITVSAELDAKPSLMRISVKDTGIGIPANKIDTIFERFRQVDASTTRKYGGSGLGLSICKQLVELHGGTINLISQEGVGSEFYFTVPLVDTVSA
jgi:signal transduction histidine kinase